MRRWTRAAARAGALLSLAAVTGCAGLGSWEDVLGGMGLPGVGGEVRGEVGWVDTRRREIEVRGGWGQTRRVEYDSRTEVIYRQQRYRVSALERGDLVSMRVQQTRRGELYTDRIYVERSAGGRSGGGYPDDYPRGRVSSYEGRVAGIDHRRGSFELRGSHGRTYLVTLPYNPSSGTRDRFRRLRRGDRVRIEGELLNDRRIELRRFR